MFLLMNDSSTSLRRFAAWAEQRDIPRLGWPVSFLPPPGMHVRAVERRARLDVFVTSDHSDTEAMARLDLNTREVIVSPRGATHRQLRQLALHYIADRNHFDRLFGIDTTPESPTFTLDDVETWSSLQSLAWFTNSLWYPPAPRPGSGVTKMQWYATARRVNKQIANQPDRPDTPAQGTDWTF